VRRYEEAITLRKSEKKRKREMMVEDGSGQVIKMTKAKIQKVVPTTRQWMRHNS